MKEKMMFNPRVHSSRDIEEMKAEIARIGSEPAGVARMAPKAVHFVVSVRNVRTPAVLVLKEEMLSKGGDCAIHRNAITHRVERSECILMGTQKQFHHLLADLRCQPFDLPRLAAEIQAALDGYTSRFPAAPDASLLSQPLQRFYSDMQNRTLIMGILNVTPDSFSDGGLYANTDAAVEHAVRLVEDGADVIDIGGESTRPQSEPVPLEEELSRVVPVLKSLSGRVQVPVSIDTYKPEVARAALDAGASIINDISGLSDPAMRILAAERKAPSVIMHMKGAPKTMQEHPTYEDLIPEVMLFLRERIAQTVEAGLPEEFIMIDPGIGFAKTAEHNLEILRNLADFKSIGRPILMGTSRKAFIGKALGGVPPTERTYGTAATVALCIANGANTVRVHDVKEMAQVAKMADEIVRRVDHFDIP